MKLLAFLIFIFFSFSKSQDNIVCFENKFSISKMISFFDTGMQIQYLVPSYENTSVFFEEKNRLKIG